MCFPRRKELIALVAAALCGATRMTAASAHGAAAFFAWTGQAYFQLAVPYVMSIEHADLLLRFILIAHFHKSKAFGLATVTIFDQRH